MRELAAILHKEFGKDYRMPTSELKYCTVKIGSWFDRRAADILAKWEKDVQFDNSRSKSLFKLDY